MNLRIASAAAGIVLAATACTPSSLGQTVFSASDCVVTPASITHGNDIKKVSYTSPGTTFYYQVASVHPGGYQCGYAYTTFADDTTNHTYCLAQKYHSGN